ncbi:hypothetical protein A7M79_00435 [Acinetobacter baumannii]|nr:hypothetical protein A7M79_00435 [Acinetobacter baumannii]
MKKPKKIMNTRDVVKFVQENDTEDDANDLLYCLNINAQERFDTACKMLGDLLEDIKKTYPDANYVVSDDHIQLLLGASHSLPESETTIGFLSRLEAERKNREVIAATNIVVGLYKCLE